MCLTEPEHPEPPAQSKRTWGDTPSGGVADAGDFPSQDFPSLVRHEKQKSNCCFVVVLFLNCCFVVVLFF